MNSNKIEFVYSPVAKVTLVSISSDPVASLAMLVRGYAQTYSPQIGEEEVEDMLEQIQKTKLKTPLEFIQTIWLIQDVSRAFTHQIVRSRVGTQFVQESLRFSDKRSAKFLVSREIRNSPEAEQVYRQGILSAVSSYEQLLQMGIPVQDARGVLPHHVLTNLFFGCSLSTLARIFEQRTCCQAQSEEWTPLMYKMREQLPEELRAFLVEPWKSGSMSCGFGASFDRPCKYQASFDAVKKEFLKEEAG